MKAEDNGSSIGISISEDLVDGINGFAHIEVGIDTDDSGSDPFDSKLAYAGVEGSAGKIQAGRMDSVFKGAVTSKTDVFPEYGGGASQKLYSRDSNLIQYSGNIGGITVDTQIKVDGSTGKDGIDVLETAATLPLAQANIGVAMTDDKVNEVKYYGAGVTVPLSDNTQTLTMRTLRKTLRQWLAQTLQQTKSQWTILSMQQHLHLVMAKSKTEQNTLQVV